MSATTPFAALTASEERTWSWLAHGSGIFGFLGPLIVWLVQRDKSLAVAREAKEALNFQLTVAMATAALFIAGTVLSFVIVGLAVLAAASFLPLVGVVFAVIGAVVASRSGTYRYPVTVRMVK
jgi:uncharacterized Tic20 family protein